MKWNQYLFIEYHGAWRPERSPTPLSSGEVGSVASRERQRDGRLPDLRRWVVFFFFFLVSVLESLAGLDRREQQLQYQALRSFTADWIRRRPSCSMPTPLPSLSHRDFFFLRAWAKRIFFSSFSEQNTKDSSSGSRSQGLKRFACAPMYSLQAGSGLFLLAVLAGLQVRLSPSGLPPDT